jgi:hypothetical protein
MSLFGTKCVRCGARTKSTYENQPTCAGCIEHIELTLTSARESKLTCPIDSQLLDKEIVYGVIIDRCPSCKGVWLDAGEMERMNEDVAAEVWKAAAIGTRPFG